jgi:hypothetical protein
MRNTLVLVLALSGCPQMQLAADGGPVTNTIDAGPILDAGLRPTDAGTTCRSQSLPASGPVRFEFPPQRCQFTLAEAALGIAFLYEVVVEPSQAASVQSAPPRTQTCSKPKDSADLYVFEQISGAGKSYCLCDLGNCPRPEPQVGAGAGRHRLTFEWTGREWRGPSDTNNPQGAPFPPGEYTFTVSSTVSDLRADAGPREVTGQLTFTLVP